MILFSMSFPVSAVYRCETADGVTFSDQPCGDNAERLTIRDNHIGGSFGDNLPTPAPETSDDPENQSKAKPVETCRFINSTELRTYLARDQVVKGMTTEQVLKAFGRPPETYPVPQETWVYQTDYYGKLYELTYVYFRDGCVESVEYRKP
ncbi:MAG: outer membrane protein assembly factor BamE [Marinobacter sp.]|uniref:outer membrane protein assembly factor BamE domain-containing protein n=1 Tax=Marinobacter sp. TaxID=50741 RepID=UPI0034A0003A